MNYKQFHIGEYTITQYANGDVRAEDKAGSVRMSSHYDVPISGFEAWKIVKTIKRLEDDNKRNG